MDWNDENLPIPEPGGWWHATVAFPGSGPSPAAAAALAAALAGRCFHFLRKEGKLRLRCRQPAADILDQLVADRLAAGWVGGVCEPEVDAYIDNRYTNPVHRIAESCGATWRAVSGERGEFSLG